MTPISRELGARAKINRHLWVSRRDESVVLYRDMLIHGRTKSGQKCVLIFLAALSMTTLFRNLT